MKGKIGILVAFFTMIGCSVQQGANGDLREKLQNHSIKRVEVLQVPEGVATVRVTPDNIEEMYHSKLELRASALLPELHSLEKALARTECRPSPSEVDVRTAILFFDEANHKVHGFYYGAGGKHGLVDKSSCELGKGLFDWARSRLPDGS
jgi:hypothetical protein